MGLFQNLTGWHALILLAIVLLLFGAAKLPALARSVGQSVHIFKTEIKDETTVDADQAAAAGDDTGQPVAAVNAWPAPDRSSRP